MIVTQMCANFIIGLKYDNALYGGKDALKFRAVCTKLSVFTYDKHKMRQKKLKPTLDAFFAWL